MNRARATGDASWVVVLAAAPILVHCVDFQAHSWNVIAWVVAGGTSVVVAFYTFLLFLVTMTHMKPEGVRDRQHQSPGIFDAENFDAAGQQLHRKFRRACLCLAFAWSMNAIVAVIFPL